MHQSRELSIHIQMSSPVQTLGPTSRLAQEMLDEDWKKFHINEDLQTAAGLIRLSCADAGYKDVEIKPLEWITRFNKP